MQTWRARGRQARLLPLIGPSFRPRTRHFFDTLCIRPALLSATTLPNFLLLHFNGI